jgi:hypothetical protein
MVHYKLNLSTSINIQTNKTNYVFAHDPENPLRQPIFENLKSQEGAYYALNGHTETGEPYNALIELKKCADEDSVETHFGGVEIYQVLKFNEDKPANRFKITLHCISLNEHSKLDERARSNFASNHKHQNKTMRFISICGQNDKFFSEVSTNLENLGYKKHQYNDGYLFYWYDDKTFNNFSIGQYSTFLFKIVFTLGDIE